MSYQITSGLAYEEVLKNLGGRQRQVLACFAFAERLNNREVSELCGFPINCVTPRIKELREMKLLVEAGKDYDQVTKRLTLFWKRA